VGAPVLLGQHLEEGGGVPAQLGGLDADERPGLAVSRPLPQEHCLPRLPEERAVHRDVLDERVRRDGRVGAIPPDGELAGAFGGNDELADSRGPRRCPIFSGQRR
jgi:hypothetical protein